MKEDIHDFSDPHVGTRDDCLCLGKGHVEMVKLLLVKYIIANHITADIALLDALPLAKIKFLVEIACYIENKTYTMKNISKLEMIHDFLLFTPSFFT